MTGSSAFGGGEGGGPEGEGEGEGQRDGEGEREGERAIKTCLLSLQGRFHCSDRRVKLT